MRWVLLPLLLLLLLPPLLATATANSTAAHSATLRLGFNAGYITDTQHYVKALGRIGRDGLGHVRVMGAFMHTQGHAVDRRAPWTAGWMRNISTAVGSNASLTLTLSDFPFNVQPDLLRTPSKYLSDWVGRPSVSRLADTLRYTNRAPPTRGAWLNGTLVDYQRILRQLQAEVAADPILAGRVDYEVANEPNALGYFWGNASDFGPVADAAVRAFQNAAGGGSGQPPPPLPPPQRVICCAFATEMSCQGMQQGGDRGFIPFAQSVTARYKAEVASGFPTALSWHFYRQDGAEAVNHLGLAANRSTYANATAFYGSALRGSVLTEWGVSTYNSPAAAALINGPLLMLELVRLLHFAAVEGLAEVDAHCLMDDPRKGGHNCFFDRFGEPRQSYFHYELVARVIRGGFTASGGDGRALTNITGSHSRLQIIAAAGDADGWNAATGTFVMTATEGIVAASSGIRVMGEGTGGGVVTLGIGEWVVVQREPIIDRV